ncbi:MAG: hypothetical protein BRD41_06625 [Bacteroidetes bacterium QS_1_63_11]|nr:MAG: hypothetical protein BRD41_06625 [Bacteroidetes bacterium QS_1_63_11]
MQPSLSKPFALLATAAFLALSIPTEASGQTAASAETAVKVGPRVGLDAGDIEEPFAGADVRIGQPASRIVINPTFDFYFTEDPLTFWSLSTNALYRFGVNNEAFTPYSGAGLGVYRSSIEGGGGATGLGLNAVFGAEFRVGSVGPFVEAQYSPVFAEGSTTSIFSVKGGLLFEF